jgi:DNA repair exonuclease SbcCD ATPase subunit
MTYHIHVIMCRRQSQEVANKATVKLNQMTIDFRDLKSEHDTIRERYEAASSALQNMRSSIKEKDDTIAKLEARAATLKAKLEQTSDDVGGKVSVLQRTLEEDRQKHQKRMLEEKARWESYAAQLQGEKVIAYENVKNVTAERDQLAAAAESMKLEEQHRAKVAQQRMEDLQQSALLHNSLYFCIFTSGHHSQGKQLLHLGLHPMHS